MKGGRPPFDPSAVLRAGRLRPFDKLRVRASQIPLMVSLSNHERPT